MVSTVKSRPNHYAILGLTPAAGGDEIARAFASKSSVFRPHSFGGVTELCLAYETLRDPTKRRTYDASIGVTPPPEPRIAPTGPRNEPSFTRPVEPRWAPQRAVDPAPRPAPQPDPKPQSGPLAGSAPAPAPKPEPPHRPAVVAERRLEPRIGGDRFPDLAPDRFGAEAVPIQWKRAGTVAGGAAAAACLIGALAGWWSAGDIEQPVQPERAVSVPLPPAARAAMDAMNPPAPVAALTEAPPERPKRAVQAAARPQRAPAPARPALAEAQPPESQPQESGSEQSQPESAASEQAAAEAPAAPAVAAALPLPNRTIARTIERIGYSCGAVASTTPAEGEAPGVYKVTCTSGQSYQAKPVNGRYRFRRWR